MTLQMLRMAIGVGALAMTTVAHAATPITLPLGSLGPQLTDTVELPVPPPPRVARPDVSQFRLILKPVPRGCDGDERRSASDRRQTVSAVPVGTGPFVRTRVPSRWG